MQHSIKRKSIQKKTMAKKKLSQKQKKSVKGQTVLVCKSCKERKSKKKFSVRQRVGKHICSACIQRWQKEEREKAKLKKLQERETKE